MIYNIITLQSSCTVVFYSLHQVIKRYNVKCQFHCATLNGWSESICELGVVLHGRSLLYTVQLCTSLVSNFKLCCLHFDIDAHAGTRAKPSTKAGARCMNVN